MFKNSISVPLRICLVAAFVSLAPGSASAGLIINLQEIGSNVVATGSGTANLAGLSYQFDSFAAPFISPRDAGIVLGTSAMHERYEGITDRPTNFGPGTALAANSVTGSRWGVFGEFLFLPTDYNSGDFLSSTATWNDTTLAGLGVTPGTYTWTWGSGANEDFLILNAGNVSAVPEPSSLALAGLACIGFVARARRRIQKCSSLFWIRLFCSHGSC